MTLLFCSLGSTRFFKVARAQSKEGPLVVKVFVIHDPSLPLKSYRDKLEGELLSVRLQLMCFVIIFFTSLVLAIAYRL